MQLVKSKDDDLALLGAPMDEEEIIDKILNGLPSDYRELVRVVQAGESSIAFEELHEKLLIFEASLQTPTSNPHSFPASAHFTYRNSNRPWHPFYHQHSHTQRPSYNQVAILS